MPRSIGVRQLPSKRCGCARCRETYPTPERSPTKNCTGSWQARWYKADGTRDSATRRKKDDALAVRNAAVAAIEAGAWLDPKRGMIPLSEWREIWLKGRTVAGSTGYNNANRWNRHVRPTWGATPLRAITYQDVQNWVVGLEAKGLAPVTVRNILSVLTMLMAAAKRDQRIGVNPCIDIVVQERKGRGDAQDKPPTIEQAEAISRAIRPVGPRRDPRQIYARIPLLILETGLRWEELAGLLPDCVDLDEGDLTVRRVLEQSGAGRFLRDYPKSEAGFRTVPLSRAARQLLAAHLEVQAPVEGEPIFRTLRGTYLDRCIFRRDVWLPATIAAGVHRSSVRPSGLTEHWPTPHDLRHSFASRLENAGVPESVRKEVLGHERPKKRDVTWLYTHAPEESRWMILAALGDRVKAPTARPRALRLVV